MFLKGVRTRPGEALEFARFIDEVCLPTLNEIEAEYFDFGSAYYFWKNRPAPTGRECFTLFGEPWEEKTLRRRWPFSLI